MGGLLLEKRKSRLAALRLEADKTQGLADRNAELANALLIVNDQQANAEIFFADCAVHCTFPIVFEITSINCCTRNGFSTHGAPVCRRVATVSSLAMSPVINTMRDARS